MRYKFVTSIALVAAIVGVALAWRSTSTVPQSLEPSPDIRCDYSYL